MRIGGRTGAATALIVGFFGLTVTTCSFKPMSTPSQVVAFGHFHQVAHRGSGQAAIYELPDKKLVLKLIDFRTDSGRDLEVLLIAASDALENETVENVDRLALGPLEKVEGDQSYALPDAFDFGKYRAVTIWSSKYRVNFTTAPLASN